MKSIKLVIFLVFLVSLPQLGLVKAQSSIFIHSDGSVEGTNKIQRNGDVYSFTENISGSLVIERDGITILMVMVFG